MHDIRAIRETPELYEMAWAAKGSSGRVAEILVQNATPVEFGQPLFRIEE